MMKEFAPPLHGSFGESPLELDAERRSSENRVDAYFSADVETDGPIPGPFSMLSFAIVYAGSFDGRRFQRPENYDQIFYRELRPISENFQEEALRVNGRDRGRFTGRTLTTELVAGLSTAAYASRHGRCD